MNQIETKKRAKELGDLMIQLKKLLNQEDKAVWERIFARRFALLESDARHLIRIVNEAVSDPDGRPVPINALPEDWIFFKNRSARGKLTDKVPQMKKEFPELRDTIRQFRKLPEDIQEKLEDRWPAESWDFLTDTGTSKQDKKFYHYNASRVAREILACRYDTDEETVERYLKGKR